MGMFEVMWEIGQQQRMVEVTHEANEARRKAGDADSRVADLEHAVDRLLLLNRALWEIVQKFHPVDNEYFLAKVAEIDLRDGRLDGKLVKQSLRHCRSCGRAIGQRHVKCIYCGSADLQGDPFSRVR